MNQVEKNQLYHTILYIIKSLPPEQAATDIVLQFEDYIENNIIAASETEELQIEGKKTKESPIFRRSG
jgi:hypothetical protein